ncbi:cmc1- cytochrome c oxidase biogenesis protein [Ophiostoma piceae UAMH 11346]|uniref:COX assembly mitochondrial protein n=1 Tax=Ophiostoma piceae (strain UAMH 11346) TaxID=1262450 RepID=S3CVG4_OPHP1|nr:cmc1- cytochrome c oxidase biogenesis protein [Ophiostoma piceae UAMH 11346]
MHPHLDAERQQGCAEVMAAFEECHARGFLWKAAGMCNDAKSKLSICLKAERSKRVTANRTDAQEKRQKVRALWKEIDENQ